MAHRTLVARGVTFESDPHLITRMGNSEIWMGFFNDLKATCRARAPSRILGPAQPRSPPPRGAYTAKLPSQWLPA